MASQKPTVDRLVRAARSRVGATRAGGVLRRVRDTVNPPTPEPAPVAGVVEQFSRALLSGWVSVPADAPAIKATLHLNGFQIAASYATPEGAMSGASGAAEAESGPVVGEPPAESVPPAPVHSWQGVNLPGPAGDRRNSRDQIRTFSFRMKGMWKYCKKGTRVSVRVNGHPLPIAGHGMFLKPQRNGASNLTELKQKFQEGYLFSQFGNLQLTKQLDTDWQNSVMGLYAKTRAIVQETHGYDPFFIYGTLLGAVREGNYIGHDIDFDAAYLSKHTDPTAAAQELADIALVLIDRGLMVEAHGPSLHLREPADPSVRIDLFHLYFNDEGVLSFPFGIAGRTLVTREDWAGLKEIDFVGGKGMIPVNAEAVVEQMYGADWRQPKPGFNWRIDRLSAAPGKTTPAQRSKVYWTNFYAHTEYTSGSRFFEFVNAYPDLPASVIDIGCGDGRDACAFGTAGRRAMGLDQSPMGIEHATKKASGLGLADQVEFRICDVADNAALSAIIDEFVADAHDAPVLFYLRFFLHSIPAKVQEKLMATIGERARPGDYLAAEFRTDKDEDADKVHGKHYRRFQNGPAFGADLVERSFTLLHEEEGTGLSPYQGEDPVLYRVVARR